LRLCPQKANEATEEHSLCPQKANEATEEHETETHAAIMHKTFTDEIIATVRHKLHRIAVLMSVAARLD